MSLALCPQLLSQQWRAWVAQWLERRTRDRKVAGSSPGRSGGRIFFSRVNFYCWLFWYPFHPVLPQQYLKDPAHSAESAGGRLQLNTHALFIHMWLCMKWRDMVPACMVYTKHACTLYTYVALHEVTRHGTCLYGVSQNTHALFIHMWLCMKWRDMVPACTVYTKHACTLYTYVALHEVTRHGTCLYGVHKTRMHSLYICGFAWSDATWYLLVWCTQNTPRRQQFHIVKQNMVYSSVRLKLSCLSYFLLMT